jgi:tRNA uridine 5-carboxymethylaminomethyl modification enzyme
MFTSRAEYRLMLREDNADLRLTPKGRELNLVDDLRWERFESKQQTISIEKERLQASFVHPNTPCAESLQPLMEKPLTREYRLLELLRRPELNYQLLMEKTQFGPGVDDTEAAQQIEIQVKYAGYIDRQEDEIAKQLRQELLRIPEDFDYRQISGLSNEVCQKLLSVRPANIGMASRIPGMTPAAISLLLVFLKKRKAAS